MEKQYNKFVLSILLILVCSLNSYILSGIDVYQTLFVKASVKMFNDLFLYRLKSKINTDWVYTYHFDNEKEEFINEDISYDIISIFDSINIDVKREFVNLF